VGAYRNYPGKENDMTETPSKGGSYIREKDGTLKRVAGTAPAKDRNEIETAKGGKRDGASAGQAAPAKARAKRGIAASDKEDSNA
jgi:hypothetical protein